MTQDTVTRLYGRIAVSACAASLAFAYAYWLRASGRYGFSDFDQIWLASRALIDHRDPYAAVAHGFQWPLLYPLPAAVIGLPFALAIKMLAPALFGAVGVGLLAFALTRNAWWPLITLMSLPVTEAVELGHWTPLLTACALIPSLSWIAIAKPTTGLAVVAAYPPRHLAWPVGIALGCVVLSFVLWPTWVPEWIAAVRSVHHVIPMVLRPGGFLLLAALIRWRRPDARLLAWLALMPATGDAYDAVPLVLLVTNFREAVAFSALSLTAGMFLQDHWVNTAAGFAGAMQQHATVLLIALYLPALVLVLRRPNHS